MKTYNDLYEAASEIKRDLSRANIVGVTRVQQQTGIDIQARELLNYSYQIRDGIPVSPGDLIRFARAEFPFYVENTLDEWISWLDRELMLRLSAGRYVNTLEPPENYHPALKSCKEGDHYGYTYPEIMFGAFETLYANLAKDPDTRRAYFPFFEKHHALRAPFPTRVPCSIGYQAMIRNIPGIGPHLILLYLQRSSDFDRFWLTDVWFARRFQLALTESLDEKIPGLRVGAFMHSIVSLHSFIGDEEIY